MVTHGVRRVGTRLGCIARGRRATARLPDVSRTSGRSEEASRLMQEYAEQVRTFNLPTVLAECLPDVSRLTPAQIQTDYPHRANANTSRYQCVHTIDVPGAGPRMIFEKCLSLNSERNRRIAERATLLRRCTDIESLPSPRLLRVVQHGEHVFLYYEYHRGRPITRYQFRARFFRPDEPEQYDVVGLIASISRAPLELRGFEEAGVPASVNDVRRAGRPAHDTGRDSGREHLERTVDFVLGDTQRDRARQIIETYFSRAEAIQDTYDRLPMVLCHGDVAPRNILVADDGELSIIDWDLWGAEPAGADLAMLSHHRIGNVIDDNLTDAPRRVFASIVQAYRSRADVNASEEEIMFACHQYWIAMQFPEIGKIRSERQLKLFLSYMHEVAALMR